MDIPIRDMNSGNKAIAEVPVIYDFKYTPAVSYYFDIALMIAVDDSSVRASKRTRYPLVFANQDLRV